VSFLQPPEQTEAIPPQAAPAGTYTPDGRWYWNGQQWQPVVAPGPAWGRPYWPLEARAAAATALFVAGCAGTVLLTLARILTAAAPNADSPLLVVSGVAGLVGLFPYVVGWLGAVIAVPIWTHLAYRNLPALGAQGLRWTPGWAAWCWFIPAANLLIPFLIVHELGVHSGPDPRPPWWVWLWLPAWLVPPPLLVLVFALALAGLGGGLVVAVANVLFNADLVAIAILLVLIIHTIARRQAARYAQLQAV
jgi:hypothetical protein